MSDAVTKSQAGQPEPWLRGTHTDVPAVIRAVLHALEQAREDAEHWCGDLTGLEVNAGLAGLPSVAFQLRHIAGSVDRLLTYAEGHDLNEAQLADLRREAEVGLLCRISCCGTFRAASNAPVSVSVALLERISNRSASSDARGCPARLAGCWCMLPNTRSGMWDR